MANKLKIGVSSCLLGEEVRHNGGHCRDRFLTDKFEEFADFIPTCPEVAIGMSTPREAVRLELEKTGAIHMRGSKSATDHTKAMRDFSEKRMAELALSDLDGYVFKRNSPSCGVFRVKIYKNGQPAERNGMGLFAEKLQQTFPHLPLEEDGRLNDPHLRENFMERVFAYRRVKDLFAPGFNPRDIVDFHSREKMLLLAHNPEIYQKLGRLVARQKEYMAEDFAKEYIGHFMDCLNHRASKGRHANAMTHMAGHLKDHLSADGKQELHQSIDDFVQGLVPMVVPMTLLQHMIRRFKADYLASQTYLNPHPKSLMLRNHA